jgi:hypothetical protein
MRFIHSAFMYNVPDIVGRRTPVVKHHDRIQRFLPFIGVGIALAIWLLLMHEFRLDDSFITYRYAHNASQGLGLVYNVGDSVLSTTAPLYALLLAGLYALVPDFHVLGGLLGSLAIGTGGVVMFYLTPAALSYAIRLWAMLAYVLSTPFWLALGMETPLWILGVLLGVWLASNERWALAGLSLGVSVLVRPDAALPGVLVGSIALWRSLQKRETGVKWWQPVMRYSASALFPVLLFALWGMVTYGSPLPVTLGAKGAQAELGITGLGPHVGMLDGLIMIVSSLLAQSPLYVIFGVLAVLGLSRHIPLTIGLLALWGGLHIIAYAVLGVAPYRWYYAPLVPGLIGLAALGADRLYRLLVDRWQLVARVGVSSLLLVGLAAPAMSLNAIAQRFTDGGPTDVMLPIIDWSVYRAVGEWIDNNTPADARIGVAEVGQVGFYARRWMTDYLGLLQPDVAAMLERGDLYSWLARYAPDYLVFQRFRGAPLVLYNLVIEDDPWFNTNYRVVTEFDDPRYSAGPVTIFERIEPVREMIEQDGSADFGGLQLQGYAIEQVDAEGTPTMRVRLDWAVTGPLPEDVYIAVKAFGIDGLPTFDGEYVTANWAAQFSTWHALVLPADVSAGEYSLLVAVGPTGGPYTEHVVGPLPVVE